MNTIHTNHMPEIYRNVANRQVKGGKTESPAFSEQTAHKSSESVVLQYKRKHPYQCANTGRGRVTRKDEL